MMTSEQKRNVEQAVQAAVDAGVPRSCLHIVWCATARDGRKRCTENCLELQLSAMMKAGTVCILSF